MSGSYQRGYDQGFGDASSGKSKVNARHLWEGIKNAANLVTGSVDEFVRGYEEGYRKGCEVRAKK